MKNLKVSMKLVVSFAIVIAVALLVAVIGAFGMSSINDADDALYNENVLAFQALGDLRSAYLNQRIQLRNLVIFEYGSEVYNNSVSTIDTYSQRMQEYILQYESTIVDDVDTKNFNVFKTAYSEFSKLVSDTDKAVSAGNMDEAMNLVFTVGASIADKATNSLLDCVKYNDDIAKEAVDDNTSLFLRMLTIQIVVLAVGIIFVILLVKYISGLISAPLKTLTGFMRIAGSTGNITLKPEDVKNIEKFAQSKDEIGQCLASTASFIKHITEIAEELGSVADGDLTTYIHALSEEDVLGVAVQKMVDNLSSMFGEINASTAQVSVGSKQIADGSQVLAQGSTEQASAVEQLSSSISEIARKTKLNAETAEKAAKLAEIIKNNAEKGSRQMNEMVSAVKEINQASQNINKVIKVIDDIAFQTNILALNAAVEAARAGQHGKGFAVVAEEVRNLAAKSAEAAKDTGGLISSSIEKAELGARIADETATSLADIVTGINESSQLVGSIARSSDEQSEGISQINKGIDQVAQVIQQNSATAEESAAASEEMSGQADVLESLVAQFKIKNNSGAPALASFSHKSSQFSAPPKSNHISHVGQNSDYGKY